ncbi:DDE-type integrase/transposase/recombinase [Spiroplasma clarkii]|nr:DDE-type integrase/transposase/recombinase [Spiroplasma clarkii]
MRSISTNNHVKWKNKVAKPEKVGKYPNLLTDPENFDKYGDVFSVDITEKEFNGERYYTCGFYHIKMKKIFGLVTEKNKGNQLVEKSFLKMTDEFGVFLPNSVIHSDNGSEFKAYNYKLMLMYFNLIPSMSRIAKSTDNGWIEGFWSVFKRECLKENYCYKGLAEYQLNASLYQKFYNYVRIKL